MRWKVYTLCLAISLLTFSMSSFSADKKERVQDKAKALLESEQPKAPFFGGVYLSADVFGFVYPVFVKDAFYNNEVSASIDLRHRFYPTVEVGYGRCNTTGELYGIRYTTAAPYYRVGLDYNAQYKSGKPSYIFCGARLGYSRSTYEVEAPSLVDPLTGDSYPFHLTDMPCNALWAEALVGIRAQIWSGLYMGWSVRYKRLLNSVTNENGNPWFIPGFGVHGKETVGATYNLTWYFHL